VADIGEPSELCAKGDTVGDMVEPAAGAGGELGFAEVSAVELALKLVALRV